MTFPPSNPESPHAQPYKWITKPPPRAANLSDELVDQHREFIQEEYWVQNKPRSVVIRLLREQSGFELSKDQFSKATRRWGFLKQPHRQRAPCQISTGNADNESVRRNTAFHSTSHEPASEAIVPWTEIPKRPRSAVSSLNSIPCDSTCDVEVRQPSPSLRRTTKRLKPGSDQDSELSTTTDVEEKANIAEVVRGGVTELVSPQAAGLLPFWDSSKHDETENLGEHELSAEYSACCYRYSKAFKHFARLSIPFGLKTPSNKQRRSRMLDMARQARAPKTRRIMLVILESELKHSSDPLTRDTMIFSAEDETSLSPAQSFQIHQHLAQFYAYGPGISIAAEHVDKSRSFVNCYCSKSPVPLDLWTFLDLYRFLKDQRHDHEPADLIDALKYDMDTLNASIKSCLECCKGQLEQIVTKDQDPGQGGPLGDFFELNLNPVEMSRVAERQNRFNSWADSGFLFGFLWKELQLAPLSNHNPLSWPHQQSMPEISATHFLMVACRMIVSRSHRFSLYRHSRIDLTLPNSFDPEDTPSYLMGINSLLSEIESCPSQPPRCFINHFVEQQSWHPPSARHHRLVHHVQAYQKESLHTVLIARRRKFHSTTPTPKAPEKTLSQSGPDLGALRDPWSEHLDSSSEITLVERSPVGQETARGCSSEHLNSSRHKSSISTILNEIYPQPVVDRRALHGFSSRYLDPMAYQNPSSMDLNRTRSRYSWRSSTNTSHSTTSSNALLTYFNTLRGNPPMARSLASQSSYSSLKSRSSSHRRFQEAGFKRHQPWSPSSLISQDSAFSMQGDESLFEGRDELFPVDSQEGQEMIVPEAQFNQADGIEFDDRRGGSTSHFVYAPTLATLRERVRNLRRK